MISEKNNKIINYDKFFPALMKTFDDLILVSSFNDSFRIEFVHESKLLRDLGYSKDNLLCKSLLKIIDFGNDTPTNDTLGNLLSNNKKKEVKLIHKNGNLIWAELTSTIFKNKNQDKLLLKLRDISKTKKLEKQIQELDNKLEKISKSVPEIRFWEIFTPKKYEMALKESENILKTMIESFPFDVFLINKNGYYTMQNSTCKKHWGDIIGKRPEEVANNEKTLVIWKKNNSSAFSGEVVTGEVIFEINGLIHYFYNIISPVYINNQIEYLIGLNIDITERKIAEQKLKESEEKYRDIAELLPDVIYEADLNSKLTYVNNVAFKKFGYTPEDLESGLPVIEFLDSDYKVKAIKQITLLLQGKPTKPEKYLMCKKDGSKFYARIHSHPILKDNKVMGFRGTITDISDIILAEEQVKESEEKFRTITEQSFMGIIILQDGVFKYYNEQARNLNGYSDKEIQNWKSYEFTKLIHPDDRNFVVEQAKRKERGANDVIYHHKYRIITKSGKIRWIDNYSKTINFRGKTADLIMSLDITDKIEAEKMLKESEEKYHKLFETSPDGVILINLEGKIIECNSAVELITGYTSKEFIGKKYMDLDPYIKDGLDKLKMDYTNLLFDNYVDEIEFSIKTKDDRIKWVQARSTLLNMKNEPYILAVIHEITSLKQVEKVLKENEKKFRDILETSSVGIMEFDIINKKLIYINPKLLEIIGFNKEETTESGFLNKIILPKDLDKLLRTNEEGEIEFRITDKNGKLKWLAGKAVPHLNEDGKISSIRVWLDDITERKMYENLIYELNINFLNFTADIQKNIKLLLETCLKLLEGDLILYINRLKINGQAEYHVITLDNSFIFTNKEFYNLFISSLFQEEHDFPQAFFDIDRMNYAKTDPFIKNHRYKGSFGKVIKSHNGLNSAICIFYKNNPILSGQDKLVLFLISDALEIEQRRWQVQQDLEKQNLTLNKINKLKTELFSRTSHELKTPLISIKGFTELLLTLHKSKLDKDVISILKEIKEGSKRLEKIINLLLESTKLEAGQLELNKSDEDLSFLIKFCINELKGLAELRNQSINVKLHNKMETKFDKERIYEVVSNLLVNAIKYTPPGGEITIKSSIKDSFYLITVRDNGIGFTDEEKNKVFKQFGKIERYGQGWDVAIEGTGLGLYITKKLVELHGGKVWLESQGRNKGTIFSFTIPIKKDEKFD